MGSRKGIRHATGKREGRRATRLCKKCSGRGYRMVGGLMIALSKWTCESCQGRGRR